MPRPTGATCYWALSGQRASPERGSSSKGLGLTVAAGLGPGESEGHLPLCPI